MTTTITDARLTEVPERTYDVVLDNGVIGAIEPAGSTRIDSDVVAGQGRTLLPGLIDTHVHLLDPSEMRAAAQAGMTTVVELGTYPDELITQLRAEKGVCDLLSAGSAASAPGSTQIAVMGFPPESGVSSPDDAERYLTWRTAADADLIKIIIEDPDATEVPALSSDTLAALVAGTHERNLLTVAHVVTTAAFDRGLDAGADILTHTVPRPPPDLPGTAPEPRRASQPGRQLITNTRLAGSPPSL